MAIASTQMKKCVIIISMVIYTMLSFILSSIPFNNVDISDGSIVMDYGLPLRWLSVHRRLAVEKDQSAAMEWWKTDKRSFKLSCLIIDVATAALAGVALTVLTLQICRCGGERFRAP